MSYYCCNLCGKGKQIGKKVSHAQNRSKKIWLPNLQSKRVWNGGNYETFKLCVKCLRTVKEMKLTPETRREGYEDKKVVVS